MPDDTPYTPRAQAYFDRIEAGIGAADPDRIAARVGEIVTAHDEWRARALNMNPAESLLAPRCRALLASDLATRLSEGIPGDKVYPHGTQNELIDEIEAIVVALARRHFGARFIEWRPVSTSMANAVVFSSLLSPGDTILSQSMDGGGNYSYHDRGPAGLMRLNVVSLPWKGDAFEIDADAVGDALLARRPKMIVVGGSNVLFPYPVRALREIADRVGALLLYDAAHLGLLISFGDFQRPLDEGAHLVTVSTHKIMGGPVGGLILTNDAAIARRISGATFPGAIQTRDQNKYAALAVALTETLKRGPALAAQVVSNARALAAALASEGLKVVAADRSYTRTQQVFLDMGSDARRFELACQAANILLTDSALPGDTARGQRNGVRMGVHEQTYLGMKEPQMREIARLMAAAFRCDDPASLAPRVAELMARHPPA